MKSVIAVCLALSLTLSTACADPELPPPGGATAPLVGGAIDHKSRGVVGLGISMGFWFFGHCTGSLIMPNLVLTARHCVARTSSPSGQGVVCGQTPFTIQGPGPIFRATAETVKPKFDGPKYYKGIGTVFVDKTANDICGYDVALIMLAGKGFPASVATPIEPRVDKNAVKDEPMSAVGYGLTQPNGKTSGTRMRIDKRKVLCFQKSCTGWVKSTEFGSDAPTCQGDSGGPALDKDGKVIGVLSRGPQGCTSSIYGDVASNKALIVEAAKAAAKSGGFPLPAWAGGPKTPDGGAATADSGAPDTGAGLADGSAGSADQALPPDPGSTDDGSCGVGGAPSSGSASGLALLLLGLAALARRRRR